MIKKCYKTGSQLTREVKDVREKLNEVIDFINNNINLFKQEEGMSNYSNVFQPELPKEEKKIDDPVVEMYEPVVSKPTEEPVDVKDILPKKTGKKSKQEND